MGNDQTGFPEPDWLSLADAYERAVKAYPDVRPERVQKALVQAFYERRIKTIGQCRAWHGDDIRVRLISAAWDPAKLRVAWDKNAYALILDAKPYLFTEVDVDRRDLQRWCRQGDASSDSVGEQPTAGEVREAALKAAGLNQRAATNHETAAGHPTDCLAVPSGGIEIIEEWISPAAAAVWVVTGDVERTRRVLLYPKDLESHVGKQSSLLWLKAEHQIKEWSTDHDEPAPKIDQALASVKQGLLQGWRSTGALASGGPPEQIDRAEWFSLELESGSARPPGGGVAWFDVHISLQDIMRDYPADADAREIEQSAANARSLELKRAHCERLFAEPGWRVWGVLSWIAYRDLAKFTAISGRRSFDTFRHYRHGEHHKIEENPAETLRHSLLGGDLIAVQEGKDLPPEFWFGKDPLNATDVYFRRKDVQELWPIISGTFSFSEIAASVERLNKDVTDVQAL